MSYLIGFVIGTAFSSACLRAVARWAGFALPTVDLLLIAGLCSGLALLPVMGWSLALAMLVLSMLLLKTTDADVWPDAIVAVTACAVIWTLASTIGWALG
ncbi:MAG TPA: hypothetical protein PLE63_07010 [Thermoleophilia bacterium]|nr:MAG: hypothetical protein BWY94_02475 [Actinobacteria bacterium ADurb.BinA094]HQF52667.1 hypothetical protein [Thermoleophilia bacterium]